MIDGIDDGTPIMLTGQSLTFKYEWVIENLLPFQKHQTGEKLASMPFSVLNNSWCLHIYPGGVNEQSKHYVSVILKRLSKNNGPVCARLEFSLTVTFKDNSSLIIGKYSVEKCTFDLQTQTAVAFKLASKYTIETHSPCSVLPKRLRASSVDKIIITCQFSAGEKSLCGTTHQVSQHSNALEKFVNNEHLSDVKFMVGGKEIFAHKMILSAHSPVFAAMFEHEMREKVENVVKIEDTSYEAFLELLRFAYTGEYFFTDKSPVSELFKATDKYQLLVLKKACEQQLLATINIRNVVDYLNLADMYDVGALKKGALDYIVAHGKEMIGKPEMEALKNVNISLFNEVLESIFARVN